MAGFENRLVAVTGGAGFIGSELVRQLLAEGASVLAIDNLVNGKRENLEGLPANRMRLVVVDIRDRDAMEHALKDVDTVFHLACLGVRHSIHAPGENHEVNATATLNLLELARTGGVRRFVYVSSSEVYGTARFAPMPEEHPTYPMTVYGGSKLAGESYTRAYWEVHRYPTVVVRPFNAFGPRSHHEGDSGEVIPKFMLRAMAGQPLVVFGDGKQTRDLTFVEDTARGILAAGLQDAAIGETINIGTGAEITIADLARMISSLVASGKAEIVHDDPRPGDVLRLYSDTSKAKRLLGFETRVTLEQGLKALLAWYTQLGKSPEDLLKQERVHNWKPAGHG